MAAYDLDKHGVFEASAGTGKTYTLERLVLRLVVERGVPLPNILLVTYTEKAAGELKDRLRRALDQERVNRPQDRERLQQALDRFDEAQISTLHGFCHRILQEFAFENREDFHSRLVSDRDLLRESLREVQRRLWPAEFGDQLPLLLDLAGYNGQNWEQRVCALAECYRPTCGDRLLPQPPDDVLAQLADWDQRLRADLPRWRKLADPLKPGRLHRHPWYEAYQEIDPGRRDRYLFPLLRWLARSADDARPLASFRKLCLLFQCQSGFRILTNPKKEHRPRLARDCPHLETLVAELEKYRTLDWSAFEHLLPVRTVAWLQAHLLSAKRERGLVSFEDMLSRLDEALDPAHSSSAGLLLARLRDRFRWAIVDEFQDTDPIQWRILKRVFLGPGHRLVVVGDPKQAIFAFRGADVHTYLAAVRTLEGRHQAQRHTLAVNWRSSPELIGALNHLFERGEWFTGEIRYTRVEAPAETEQRNRLLADRSGRAALNLVEIHSTRLADARRRYARFIAGEISRLLRPAAPLLELSLNREAPRPLRADDLAILVGKRREAAPVLDALRQAGIPFSFYKQSGLWQSDEASHLGCLLKALAQPTEKSAFRKALLTRFFRVRPEELAHCDELPPSHSARQLFEEWCLLADRRRWAELFQSIVEKSGILFRERLKPDADRQRANLRYIVQTLEQSAYDQDLDLLGVCQRLEELRRQPEQDELDLQPIETARPTVRVMTIHAAKGLEFPVVFLAGGFTQGKAPDWLSYRLPASRAGEDSGEKCTVFDLRKEDAQAKGLHGLERADEERRLLYVALTRAMLKLYVPVPLHAEGQQFKGVSPLLRILVPALERAKPQTLGPPLAGVVPVAEVALSAPAEPLSAAAAAEAPPALPPVLFPALDPDLRQRRVRIRSFSSLHREAAPEAPTYLERLTRAEEEEPAPADDDPFRGAAFGEMVHDVLERIDFQQAGQAADADALLAGPARELIEAQIQRHWRKLPPRLSAGPDRREECARQVARLAWLALHTPLEAIGGPLHRIPPADRLHELEFHFPELEAPPPEVLRQEGFLAGLMDLVFRHDGRYFLLDWKTNDLHGRYAAADLVRSMQELDYVRQYRLYLQALHRWLVRVHGKDFDFGRRFGGVYYLFLRGLNGRDESSGVFFCQPTAEDLKLERVLND